MKRVIVDTGPLVAFMDRGEPYHAWSVAQLEQVQGSLLSCEAVVLTTDSRDFLVYRRFERQRIPFLAPQLA